MHFVVYKIVVQNQIGSKVETKVKCHTRVFSFIQYVQNNHFQRKKN